MARQHSHKFTIADDDAVRVLVDKLVNAGPQHLHREKLLRGSTTRRGTTRIPTGRSGRRSSMDC
jgi:hypothetical protein